MTHQAVFLAAAPDILTPVWDNLVRPAMAALVGLIGLGGVYYMVTQLFGTHHTPKTIFLEGVLIVAALVASFFAIKALVPDPKTIISWVG